MTKDTGSYYFTQNKIQTTSQAVEKKKNIQNPQQSSLVLLVSWPRKQLVLNKKTHQQLISKVVAMTWHTPGQGIQTAQRVWRKMLQVPVAWWQHADTGDEPEDGYIIMYIYMLEKAQKKQYCMVW